MKTVIFKKGKGLVVSEVPEPEMNPDQVRVQVADCGFCGSDHTLIESGNLADGYILGHEVSGTVVGIGENVQGVEMGMRVIIRPTFCGTCADCRAGKPYFCQNDRRSIGIGDLPGGFAETILVYPQMLIPVPNGVDSQNAALAEAFAASLHGIHCSGKEGGSALVTGGGPIGLALVRLLKIKGFAPVILSEPVAWKREIAKTFGADVMIDPLTENLGACIFQHTQGKGAEAVFECAGVPELLEPAMNACARGGTVCIVSMMGRPAQISPMILNFKELWVTGAYSNTHAENRHCLDLMAAGELDGRPLITDTITLDELPKVYHERIHPGKAVKVMVRIGEAF